MATTGKQSVLSGVILQTTPKYIKGSCSRTFSKLSVLACSPLALTRVLFYSPDGRIISEGRCVLYRKFSS
jgi:hypothetical protein